MQCRRPLFIGEMMILTLENVASYMCTFVAILRNRGPGLGFKGSKLSNVISVREGR